MFLSKPILSCLELLIVIEVKFNDCGPKLFFTLIRLGLRSKAMQCLIASKVEMPGHLFDKMLAE